jgi:hypothetical protein
MKGLKSLNPQPFKGPKGVLILNHERFIKSLNPKPLKGSQGVLI